MKGFPKQPDGAIGPWYRKVNERIKEAATCTSAHALIDLLGAPDRTDSAGNIITPSQFFEQIGSIFRFEDADAETVLTYVDPYRSRIRYKFGLVGEQVSSYWKETVDKANEDKI